MAEIWFSSDLHFDHENIIRFCNRPFGSVKEMNEAIISNHNARVKPQDHYYNLGDVTMIRGGVQQQNRLNAWVRALNGHKRLIMGNHDHFDAYTYLNAGFEKIMAMQVFDNIRFTHIPTHPTSMGSMLANVHGHIHNQASPPAVLQLGKNGEIYVKPYINISCEMTNYAPIHLDEIKSLIQTTLLKETDGKDLEVQIETTS